MAGVENTFNENSIYTLKMFHNKIGLNEKNKAMIKKTREKEPEPIVFNVTPNNVDFEINALLQTVELKDEKGKSKNVQTYKSRS